MVNKIGSVVSTFTISSTVWLLVLTKPPNFVSASVRFHSNPAVEIVEAHPTGIIPQHGPKADRGVCNILKPGASKNVMFSSLTR
jgi:hypothetical protein